MNGPVPLRVRVEVPAAPAPGLLRAAIERRLAGSAFTAGPEDAVGKAVADAVAASQRAEQS